MSHRFTEDELDHLTPEDHDPDPQPTAAHNDINDATEAVPFDPFADDEDGEEAEGNSSGFTSTDGAQSPHSNLTDAHDATAAVPYDPFADDEDEDEDSLAEDNGLPGIDEDDSSDAARG